VKTSYANYEDAKAFVELLNYNNVDGHRDWCLFSSVDMAYEWTLSTAEYSVKTEYITGLGGGYFKPVEKMWITGQDSTSNPYYWDFWMATFDMSVGESAETVKQDSMGNNAVTERFSSYGFVVLRGQTESKYVDEYTLTGQNASGKKFKVSDLLDSSIGTFTSGGETYVAYNGFIDQTAYANYDDAVAFAKLLNDDNAGGYNDWSLLSSADMAYDWWISTADSISVTSMVTGITSGRFTFGTVNSIWTSKEMNDSKAYSWSCSDANTEVWWNTDADGIKEKSLFGDPKTWSLPTGGFVVCRKASASDLGTGSTKLSLIVDICHLEEVKGTAATCTKSGVKSYYKCKDAECGKNYADANATEIIENVETWLTDSEGGVIAALGHKKGSHHEATATCTLAGTKEYWDCSNAGCAAKLDSEGCEIADIDLPALGHKADTTKKTEAVAGTCCTPGTLAYYACANGCDEKLDKDGNVLESIEGAIDTSNHEAENTTWVKTKDTHEEYYECCDMLVTEEAAHNYGTEGAERYTCSVCSYVDEDLKADADFADTHVCELEEVKGKAATCTESGVKSYYKCKETKCGKLYADAAGTEVIEDIDAWLTDSEGGVIAALGHKADTTKKTEAVAGTCKTPGTLEYYACANGCDEKLDKDGKVLDSIVGEIDADNHKADTTKKTEAVAGTCCTPGTLEYYACANGCDEKVDIDGNAFSSVEGETEPGKHEADKTTWEKTKDTHKEYYECCGLEVTSEEAHCYDTEGEARYTCSVCEYVDEELKAAAEKADEEEAERKAEEEAAAKAAKELAEAKEAAKAAIDEELGENALEEAINEAEAAKKAIDEAETIADVETAKNEGLEAVKEGNIEPSQIEGICQMVDPEGRGILIGLDPTTVKKGYSAEILVLDCSLLAENKPAWIYTSGICGFDENGLWTTVNLQYGYYWTLFRIYDKDGKLVDEQCYGFENI